MTTEETLLPRATRSAPGRGRERVAVLGRTALGLAYARFLSLWAAGTVEVFLIGSMSGPHDIDPARLRRECRDHGIRLPDAEVVGIAAEDRYAVLADGQRLHFDRLVVAPDQPPDTPV